MRWKSLSKPPKESHNLYNSRRTEPGIST